jgi:hypothetical protein
VVAKPKLGGEVVPLRSPELHVSVSQIKTYLRCPRQYQLKYVLGIEPAFMPVAFAFGSAFHTALGYYYGMVKATGTVPVLEEVTAVFNDAWTNESSGPLALQAEDEDGGVDHPAKGAAMLAVFHTHAGASQVIVEEVEKGFAIELHDPDTGQLLEEKLVGAFDLVVLEGKRRVIVEHKSSARKYTVDQIKYDVQPTAYKLAGKQLGFPKVGVRFQIVTKTKTPTVQVEDLRRDHQSIDDFLRTAVGVLRAIDAGAFYPVRGWQCRSCQFAHACTAR